MNFIKNLFEEKSGGKEHLQFQKFSKGEFINRALIRVKKVGKKITINTSAEFANGLVFSVAEEVGKEKVQVTGAIVSTQDLTGEIDFKEKKQFQGVKRYILDKEMTGTEILGLLEKFPKNFFALSFESNQSKLKIKPKAPKAPKAGTKGEGPKADFCKLITLNKKLGDSFVFEKQDFKEAEINHVFFIESIEISDELKKSGDFLKIREDAKRVGKIVRTSVIDGEKKVSEFKFKA